MSFQPLVRVVASRRSILARTEWQNDVVRIMTGATWQWWVNGAASSWNCSELDLMPVEVHPLQTLHSSVPEEPIKVLMHRFFAVPQ